MEHSELIQTLDRLRNLPAETEIVEFKCILCVCFVPLIEKRTQPSCPLIPLFSVNKGIRENGKWVALLLRVLSKNKGLIQNKSEYFLFAWLVFGIFVTYERKIICTSFGTWEVKRDLNKI